MFLSKLRMFFLNVKGAFVYFHFLGVKIKKVIDKCPHHITDKERNHYHCFPASSFSFGRYDGQTNGQF